jgi:transcriptional regulator with XRE-family HTH domain
MSGEGSVVSLEVGIAIRRRRRELELSQEGLAHRLHISCQQVQRYEAGKNVLNVERLQLIARALFVPIEYFFSRAPAGDEVASTVTIVCNRDEAELLALYRKVQSGETKGLIMELARLAAEPGQGRQEDRQERAENLGLITMLARESDEETVSHRPLVGAFPFAGG